MNKRNAPCPSKLPPAPFYFCAHKHKGLPPKAAGFKHTRDAGQRRGAHKAAAAAQSTRSASPLNQTTFFLKTADLSSRSP